MPKRLLIIMALLAIMLGCTNSHQDEVVSSMQWLRTAKPEADANKAVKKNDLKYLAITGYSTTIPGLSKEIELDILKKENYRIIGYCELMEGREHMRLCVLAGDYAASYNQRLLLQAK